MANPNPRIDYALEVRNHARMALALTKASAERGRDALMMLEYSRKKQGLTARAAAAILGISAQYYSDLVKKRRTPSVELLRKLEYWR